MAATRGDRGSMLVLEERFEREDPLFVEELRALYAPKALASFAARWVRDPRPWARRQLREYLLERPLDRPGHHALVKRLFKGAEAEQDDELMGWFLVVFDRLVRRVRKSRWRYEPATRAAWQHEVLRVPSGSVIRASEALPAGPPEWMRGLEPAPRGLYWMRNPRTGVPTLARLPRRRKRRKPPERRLYSYRTRYYLRRRAWRYFRQLGFRRPDEYVEAIARALELYRDEDLAAGENLLDSWGLMNACFRGHEALDLGSTHVRLRGGRSLAELSAAPRFPQLWRQAAAAGVLLRLAVEARSRAVRVFAMELLRREHAGSLAGRTPEAVLRLLEHEDADVQLLGAELLRTASGLEAVPVGLWLRMLATSSTLALEAVCEVLLQKVPPGRFGLAECLELACAEPVPVARLGLRLLRSRSFERAEDRSALAGLARARCAAAARELTAWALGVLGAPEHYDRDTVSGFFDARLREVREGALDWLVPGSAGHEDAALWARLLETPFEDVRLRLVEALERHARRQGGSGDRSGGVQAGRASPPAPIHPDDLRSLWCSVLLGVHRGGRQKLKAVEQLGRALAAEPERAGQLVPVLGAAIRSVRAPESRAGLAALLGALEARPELAAEVERCLPELAVAAGGNPGDERAAGRR